MCIRDSAYSSGTAPDIAGIGGATSGFDLKTFVEAGIIDPLNDYITDPEYEKATEASTLQFEGCLLYTSTHV